MRFVRSALLLVGVIQFTLAAGFFFSADVGNGTLALARYTFVLHLHCSHPSRRRRTPHLDRAFRQSGNRLNDDRLQRGAGYLLPICKPCNPLKSTFQF